MKGRGESAVFLLDFMLIIIFAKEPRALDAIQEENACKMLGYKETMKEHVVISGEIISNKRKRYQGGD